MALGERILWQRWRRFLKEPQLQGIYLAIARRSRISGIPTPRPSLLSSGKKLDKCHECCRFGEAESGSFYCWAGDWQGGIVPSLMFFFGRHVNFALPDDFSQCTTSSMDSWGLSQDTLQIELGWCGRKETLFRMFIKDCIDYSSVQYVGRIDDRGETASLPSDRC